MNEYSTGYVIDLIEKRCVDSDCLERFVLDKRPDLLRELQGKEGYKAQVNWLVGTAYSGKFLNDLVAQLQPSSQNPIRPGIADQDRLPRPMLRAVLNIELAERDYRDEITKFIRDKRVLPMSYAYMGNSGFRNWIDLTDDDRYLYYQVAKSYYVNYSDRIVDVVLNYLRKTHPIPRGLEFVSLGAGDGLKDSYLMSSFVKQADEWNIQYSPIDINWRMVARAAATVLDELGDSRKDHLGKAMITDFDSLPALGDTYRRQDVPTVFGLLGNTLGNMREDRQFLGSLFHHNMSHGDILLIEVRTGSDQQPLTDRKKAKRFFCGPLRTLGCGNDTENNLAVSEPRRRLSQIPEALTQVVSVKTLTLGDTPYEDVELYYIHHYQLNALADDAKQIGFEVVERLPPTTDAGFGILVLAKPMSNRVEGST